MSLSTSDYMNECDKTRLIPMRKQWVECRWQEEMSFEEERPYLEMTRQIELQECKYIPRLSRE